MAPPEKSRVLVALALIAVVAGMLMWSSRQIEKPPAAGPPQSGVPLEAEGNAAAPGARKGGPPAVAEVPADPGAIDERAAPAVPGAAPTKTPGAPPATALAAVTPVAGLDLTGELDQVQMTLRDFRTVHGENPVGTNAEITRALMGDNLKQIKLPVPSGSQLNAAGELSDRWGTPYFFHQVSKTQMEVRSAGPDRTMWTNDDRQM